MDSSAIVGSSALASYERYFLRTDLRASAYASARAAKVLREIMDSRPRKLREEVGNILMMLTLYREHRKDSAAISSTMDGFLISSVDKWDARYKFSDLKQVDHPATEDDWLKMALSVRRLRMPWPGRMLLTMSELRPTPTAPGEIADHIVAERWDMALKVFMTEYFKLWVVEDNERRPAVFRANAKSMLALSQFACDSVTNMVRDPAHRHLSFSSTVKYGDASTRLLVSGQDEDMIYFATHVVLFLSAWGTRRISPDLEIPTGLWLDKFGVWLSELMASRAIEEWNREIVVELCLCALILEKTAAETAMAVLAGSEDVERKSPRPRRMSWRHAQTEEDSDTELDEEEDELRQEAEASPWKVWVRKEVNLLRLLWGMRTDKQRKARPGNLKNIFCAPNKHPTRKALHIDYHHHILVAFLFCQIHNM